MNQSKC